MATNLRLRARGRPEGRRRRLDVRLRVLLAILLALGLGAPLAPPLVARLGAHEVPPHVTVLAYVHPVGRTLHVVLRVPLAAMRDLDLPLRRGVPGEAAGLLDVARADGALRDAARLWIADYLAVDADGRRLAAPRIAAVRASLPSDRAFASYAGAVAHLRRPPPASTLAGGELPWTQALLDVALEYDVPREDARFTIHPALAHLGVRTATVLRFVPARGAERVFRYDGDPGPVRLEPRWHDAAATFAALGFRHILDGIDHLLFVLCLVVPLRRVRPLVGVVTAFTAGHSVTLAAAASGLAPTALWFPPLVEVLVAASIVSMACANALGAATERRWLLAFGFGLVHGFAFSTALSASMQFAGAHLATALLAFNVGVEAGQLVVVALAVPALAWAVRRAGARARALTIVLSALAGHTAWHWMLERGATLGAYRIAWPAFDRALLEAAVRVATLGAIVAAAFWLASVVAGRLARAETAPQVGGD